MRRLCLEPAQHALRILHCRRSGVPITNYGVAIAHLLGLYLSGRLHRLPCAVGRQRSCFTVCQTLALRDLRGALLKARSYSQLGSRFSSQPITPICQVLTANELPRSMTRAIRSAASSASVRNGIE